MNVLYYLQATSQFSVGFALLVCVLYSEVRFVFYSERVLKTNSIVIVQCMDVWISVYTLKINMNLRSPFLL